MNLLKTITFLIALACSISFFLDVLDKYISKGEFEGYEFLVLLGTIFSWSFLYYLNL